jgi:phthalate 4,5-cis-dihydrodiol dehydrogenase
VFKFLSRAGRNAKVPPPSGRKLERLGIGVPDPSLLRGPLGDAAESVRIVVTRGGDEQDPVGRLVADPGVDALFLTSSRKEFAREAKLAAEAGKHVALEMSSTPVPAVLDEIASCCERAGVYLLAAHAHSFDAIYLRTKALIDAGSYGPVRFIEGLSYSEDALSPTHPAKAVDQLYMQADLVRLLAGPVVSRVRLVRSRMGHGSDRRHVAQFWLPSGAVASLTYGGPRRFNSDEWCGGVDRQGLSTAQSGDLFVRPRTHRHCGPLIISCETADLRPLPDGILAYEDSRSSVVHSAAPARSCEEQMIDALCRAIIDGSAPTFDGRWARDTLYVHAALLQSAEMDADVWLADGRIAQTRAAFPPFGAPT